MITYEQQFIKMHIDFWIKATHVLSVITDIIMNHPHISCETRKFRNNRI
jgi:hypothetical protein